MTKPRKDLYATITNQIITSLEQGVRPWMKPWSSDNLNGRVLMPLRSTGETYQGINVLLLWGEAMLQGYQSPTWMTLRQANKLKAKVRKGERGTMVVYANSLLRKETTDNGEDIEVNIPYLKSYTVFNCDQIAGLPEHFYNKPERLPENPIERDQRLDAYFANTGADIRHGGNMAYYSITHDYVQLPPIEAFHHQEGYYATKAHEMIHWTRHKSRLDRDFGRKKWGDEGYAQEELVAEIGAAFLCSTLDITPEVREDHVAYIENWLQVLRNDKRAVFRAASYAQKAVDFLDNLQNESTAVEAQGIAA